MVQWTFQSLCKELEDKPIFSDSMEDLKTLIGAVALLVSDSATGGIAILIKTLAEKEKLISLSKVVLQKILAQKPKDYSGRVNQMKEAYGLIYFTAFFDELDQQLPKNIRQGINLSLKEKKAISNPVGSTGNLEKQEISFPDIVYGYNTVDEQLEEMYKFMADRLQAFVRCLSFQDIATEKDIRIFDEVMKKLPKAAVERFHAQYFTLCSQFNEFYIFAQIEREKEQEVQWEEQYHNILSAAMSNQNSVNAGLENLKGIILEQPNQIKKEKVQAIVDELIKTYQNSIERPLIETKSDDEKLKYPFISKAFIPQAYKLLKYSGKEALELPETWEKLKPQQNMMSFWAKYCLDPSSVENLLLILGEPGGGKSLLTRILCARMIAPTSIFIRIPLREHDMEDEIESIVCRQIERDGDVSEPFQKFKWFAEEFPGSPITLLFDGYDEVLQATGGVYRNLLRKILRFQNYCQEQNRPVRIIITSRETLIDKADIPERTVVLKLLEFDDARKKKWIDIWNEHNHNALLEAGIGDFSLPEKNKDIEELSGQPLLLLMLAIYDANFETKTNALKRKDGQTEYLDRTKLYDELLRRFIRRELRKGPKGEECSFDDADEAEQDSMVDEEMKKLGIAALGMFVREKLSLKVGELEDDLKYMNAKETNYGNQNKKMLKNAETVFGSFFFIHDSRFGEEDDEKEAAFEFLHKTFYEFLVADLILQYLIDVIDDLNDRKSNKKRGETYYREALDNPDSFDGAYYAALSGSCLCMEPEIIQMIAEWKDSKWSNYFHEKRADFGDVMAQVMEDLFNKHVAMIRSGILTPSTWGNGSWADSRPYPQSCAVYLMNLLILQILIRGQCQIKVEEWGYISQFLKLNSPLPKKDRLVQSSEGKVTQQLKINPSEEIILKFMALFQLQRDGENVILEKRMQVREFERENLLEARMDVFNFMQDEVTWKLYKLHDVDTSLRLKQQYRRNLYLQGANFRLEIIIADLQNALLDQVPIDPLTVERMISAGIDYLYQNYKDASLVLNWMLCIRQIVSRGLDLPKDSIIWEKLTSLIFRRYIEQKEIVLIFLEIIRTLGLGDILLKNRYGEDILYHIEILPPELVAAVFETIPWNSYRIQKERGLYGKEHDKIYKIMADILDEAPPKTIVTLLKRFVLDDKSLLPQTILKKIQMQWNYYLANSPEELPELLKIYLQMGKYREVRGFLRYIEKERIIEPLRRCPSAVDEFLDVAQAVGEALNFSNYIVRQWGEGSELIRKCPHTFLKLIWYAVLGKHIQIDISILLDEFLGQYNVLFYYDAEEAVYILFRIFQKQMFSRYERYFFRACIHSLQNYDILLEKSVKAAIRILILLAMVNKSKSLRFMHRITPFFDELYREKGDTYLQSYVELCFNQAVFICNRADVPALVELLDNMDGGTIKVLEKYFKEQYLFLKMYSNKLAEKIASIYSLS